MSNYNKRKADKDLNHENWDEEDEPEDMGEFRRATEEQMRQRKIMVPKRKLAGSGDAPGTSSATDAEINNPSPRNSNPFSNLALATQSAPVAPGFNFGFAGSSEGVTCGTGTVAQGGSGSFFKIAGITPSAEPPTRASADSSTADTSNDFVPASGSKDSEEAAGAPEEESSNSSSLPWNHGAREQNNAIDAEGENADNASWTEGEISLNSPVVPPVTMGQVASSSGPADSSESSSSNHHHVSGPFSIFSSNNISTGGSNIRSPPTVSVATTSASPFHGVGSSTSLVQNAISPESSGIVRSSLEDDSGDYENDTTSSSNKLLSENEVSNDYGNEVEGARGGENNGANSEDREAEAQAGLDS